MHLYVGKALGWRLKQLEHSAVRGSITMPTEIQSVAGRNCARDEQGSISILTTGP